MVAQPAAEGFSRDTYPESSHISKRALESESRAPHFGNGYWLYVQILDIAGVVLQELAARFDIVAHQS